MRVSCLLSVTCAFGTLICNGDPGGNKCCNKSLVVTSSGGVASNKYQKNRTGVYYETRVENGHSVYQHENGKSYIIFHPKYGWRVVYDSKVYAPEIKFANCIEMCPANCIDYEKWEYYDEENDVMTKDNTLRVKCKPIKHLEKSQYATVAIIATIVGIPILLIIISISIFIYKRKQTTEHTKKDDSAASRTTLERRNVSTVELEMIEITGNLPIISHEIVALTKDEEPDETPPEDVKNANEVVDKEGQHAISLPLQLIGTPDMVNPNRDIKDQVKVLPYNNKREIPRSNFETIDIVGSGKFGTVYKGVVNGLYGPNSKTQIAIKTNSCVGDTELSEFLDEIKIMSHVTPHLNLVSMVGYCTSELNKTGEVWLLIDFCQFGDLKNYLILHEEKILSGSNRDPINSRCLIKWAHDIAKGMEFLMKNKIMHGDLAARNIMLDENPWRSGYPVAKVADFGLSKRFYDNITYEKSARLMVPWKWMAYEYLTKGTLRLNSDVWSFAVVFWEILSFGGVPYGMLGFNETLELLQSGYRLPCPKEIKNVRSWTPQKLYNKLSMVCFKAKPADRATFSHVIKIIEDQLTKEELETYAKMNAQYTLRTARYLKLGELAAVH